MSGCSGEKRQGQLFNVIGLSSSKVGVVLDW